MTRSKQDGGTTWATLPPLREQQTHSCKPRRLKRAARLVKNHDPSADDVAAHFEVKAEPEPEHEQAISDAHRHARASDKKPANESEVASSRAVLENPQVGDSPGVLTNRGPDSQPL
ncbi:hypothetical protein MPTK1_3g07720 [Marchantia polymorpha subsp. ruderalis]|uniref:Uncharacterized protein n=2 Tax=Marchantia polymorpha TaxID=3197 RepID=A0AAF6AYG5_MARPO|nr:hypothetical protein MARPO_0006s0249 [Marchantia polymorpha]BBN04799.1 hypothetical protein Mp_3g07720 [Marchantia polymorpha subsp. ruderalis]|eukprot:PTQ48250.1 hypothetical protein MARPO_0006s0249 [Marchantia polymorpha]